MFQVKLVLKPIHLFGKIRSIGIHKIIESENDIEDALEVASRDQFQTIYFYVSDLTLIKYAKTLVESYNDHFLLTGTDI